MKVYFTADLHLNHANIIKYAHRPFKNISHMNREIIKRWNKKVNKDDLVYHVGDFCFKGQTNARMFEEKLNGNIVHIFGNHDRNNGVKTYIEKCMMYFGGKEVFVQHRPPEIVVFSDFSICGHVHNSWLYKVMDDNHIVINVGVDMHNYEPISTISLLKLYNKIKYAVKTNDKNL